MNTNTEFPYSFEVYSKEHPEKFETRINRQKQILYAAGAVAIALIAFVPGVASQIPILSYVPYWMILAAGVLGFLYCLMVVFADCDGLYNLQSGGKIKHIGLKKFDRVNAKSDEVLAAFNRRDFDFLADAAWTNNDPLQLYVHEDAQGKEFYLHLRAYSSPSEFNGASEVITVSGNEYDQFRTAIRSIGPVK